MIWLDGTDDDGCYRGGAKNSPYAIFDDAIQDWIVAEIRWRWLAVILYRWHLWRRG